MEDPLIHRRDREGLSIGQLARQVGISPDTLRVWERRYGQPVPVRLSSGHRRYSQEEAHRLRCVAVLLGRGQRPGDLLELSTSELEGRLRMVRGAASGPTETWMALARSHRARDLAASMLREGRARSARDLVEACLLPFLREVERRHGEGHLGARHAQLARSAVRETLFALRSGNGRRATGAPLLIAPHSLEQEVLQAMLLAHLAEGRHDDVRLVDEVLPFDELGHLARELDARAIVLAVSVPHGGGGLDALLDALPGRATLVTAGVGLRTSSRGPGGVRNLSDLREFRDWLESLPRAEVVR